MVKHLEGAELNRLFVYVIHRENYHYRELIAK